MSYATTDLTDAHPEAFQVAEPIFRDFGGRLAFHGPMVTLKLFEDNALVRGTLETPGEGRVLVVDGGGSLRCALLGDQLAELAVRNAWAGVVVYGCIRDSEAIGGLPLGVKALATHPVKSIKRGEGQRDIPVRFAGIQFRPGAWLYADGDGLILSDLPMSA
ncbi:ribonuclease E activity regulator RraA [Candidatus Macondimonas diazotrophica]|jgi:regulator of ribonuclease activity A|uniref:4-hydroxy-4-methyl-2-oxoglutarate aldolase n=1 Tax=Candidatus Macondimonas diazotrophica TaxID=2305248 RepID=A0A4Z0FCL0_9GAMM|nr:ribonuclease E activity regulator RraA [Candidatus Macondimonas diazotrophica]TFZ83524.1 RraA family protein [Candidatus Macondimonas diazotrophica]